MMFAARAAVFLLACVCLGCIAGCKGAGTPPPQSPAEVNVYGETDKTVASGRLYELTENNLQKGLAVDFTEGQIAECNRLLPTLACEDAPCEADENQARYMVHLYNEAQEQIYGFFVDDDGNIYTEEKRLVVDEEWNLFLHDIIGQ